MKAATFEKKLEAAWPGQFKLLSDYSGCSDPIVVKCRKCGNVRRVPQASELLRVGCSSCRKSEVFAEKLEAAWPGQFKLLSDYSGRSDPIVVKCRKCGRVKRVKRADYLLRAGCVVCKNPKRKKKRSKLSALDLFIERLEAEAPGRYEILTEFAGRCKPIEARCLQCGQIRKVAQARDLTVWECPVCSTAKKKPQRKGQTAEQFERELEEARPGQYEILTEFAGRYKPIEARCLQCGQIRKVAQARNLIVRECPVCSRVKSRGPRRKSTESFREKLEKVCPGRYEILSDYMGSHDPIRARCLQCGEIREVKEARNLIRRECPVCERSSRIANLWDQNIQAAEAKGFTALSEFEARRTSMIWKCKECGRTFERTPEDVVVRGIACDHGAAELRKARADLIAVVKRIGSQKNREARREEREEIFREKLAEYEARGYTVLAIAPDLSSVTLRHDICGRVYTASRWSIDRGSGCLACSRVGSSEGVREIERILDAAGVEYEREKKFESCRRINPLPFDFEILEDGKTKALIEYNGEQHYRATVMFGGPEKLEQIQDSDRIKREWAEAEGIPLLVIRYDEDIRSRLSEIL